MRTFSWLVIIMDITLLLLLWLYIYDLYIKDHFDDFEYTTHIFNSDEAVPIIGFGVLLNTGALIFIIRDARRKKREAVRESRESLISRNLKHAVRQDEIKELEEELESIVTRLEELRKTSEGGG